MESLHQSIPRCTPLTRCEQNFDLQWGPQCKVYALAVVHHVLCACGQLLPYKNGDASALSARKIAKSCGSAIGEITSPELFQKVACRMGMATSLREYKDSVEMVSLLDHAFRAGRHVIVFVQMDQDTYSHPASSDCHSQWLEHAIVVVGWSSDTLTTLKAEGGVSKVEYKTLSVTCFNRSGGIEDISLSEIYNSSCQVAEQRKPERFYKHLTVKDHVPDRTIKDSWLGICDSYRKGRGSCYWHDFDSSYHLCLKLHREKYPDLYISYDSDALFDRAASGLIPEIVTRESFSDNGSFRKKLVVVSLKTTDDTHRAF